MDQGRVVEIRANPTQNQCSTSDKAGPLIIEDILQAQDSGGDVFLDKRGNFE